MMQDMTGKSLDRRSFLRGSAVFAAALGLAVAPVFAQQQDPERKKDQEKPADPFGDEKKGEPKPLIDKDGYEYRVCPQCGNNMYKQGRMWVCENCGYSYIE